MSDWASISRESLPAGENEVTVTPDVHTGRQERSAVVAFAAASGLVVRRSVKQEGKDAFVEVSNIPSSDRAFTVPAAGGTVELQGVSNAASLGLLPTGTMSNAPRGAEIEAGGETTEVADALSQTAIPGDPGASSEYAFSFRMNYAERTGRNRSSDYMRLSDGSHSSGYFFVRQEGADMFVTNDGGVAQLTVPADGAKTAAFSGRSNLRSLGFYRGDSSPWALGLPMDGTLSVTGGASGGTSSVEVAEADTPYTIPGDPGADADYGWKLSVRNFPANTGRVQKSGRWLVKYSSVFIPVADVVQPSPGEFCELETVVPTSYNFPLSEDGVLSIKGRSNCTNVWITGLTAGDLQNAEMYVDGSKASEWEANNTEPGNIYEFRGEDEAYEWELRVSFPATPVIQMVRNCKLGWVGGNASHALATFRITRR